MNLRAVHLLSKGKVTQALINNKGKGKVKGKAKGKGKAGGKSGETEGRLPMYFGQDGYIVCTIAYGKCVLQAQAMSSSSLPSKVDVLALQTRIGDPGVLYWTEATKIVQRLEAVHRTTGCDFSYDVSEVSKDLATYDYVQNAHVGTKVALVLRVAALESKTTYESHEPYLEVHGVDMDGTQVAFLRLWQWTCNEMRIGGTYIIRALEIKVATHWSMHEARYVPKSDNSKTLACTNLTAVEDVSHVLPITSFFDLSLIHISEPTRQEAISYGLIWW